MIRNFVIALLAAACGSVSAPPGNQAGTDGAVDADAPSGQPQLAIDRTTADLGSVIVGQTSAPATFTITNTGGVVSGTVQAAVTGAGYGITTNGCTGTLAPNASCQVSVAVTPSVPGTPSGTLTVTAIPGGSVNAALAATALTVGVLGATPPGFGFGTTVAGTTSGMTTITVQNTGGQATGVIAVALGGADPSEFEITSDGCVGMSLASYASCQLVARFRPGAPSAGAKSATITTTANPGGAAVTALTGTAQPPAAFALSGSGTFGGTLVGTPVVRTFMVTNTGQQTTGAFTVIRSGSTSFTLLTGMAGDCVSGTTTLAGGSSCNIRVQFAPSGSGAVSGTLMVSANPGGSQSTALSGNGLSPAALSVSPAVANLGSVIVGQTSAPATFTITNTGGVASGTMQASVTGAGYAITTNGCTGTLASNASCQVSVKVTPSAPGTPTGTLTVAATPGGSVNAALAATALALSALTSAPLSFDFQTTIAGTTSGTTTISVQNTPGGQTTGTIAVVLGGANPSEFEITSDGCTGMTLAGNASCQLVARFRPDATSIGAKSATITATATPGGAAVTALTGTAQHPAVLALSGSGIFGDTLVGTPVVRTFTVTNTGQQTTGALTVSRSGSTSFTLLTGLAGDCVSGTTTLTGGSSCSIRVQFTPGSPGAVSGILTVSANPGGSQSAVLSGNGLSPSALSVSPATANLGSLTVGQTSAPATFTITNTGGAVSGTVQASVTGAGYAITTNGCTGTLAPSASCQVRVMVTPSAPGTSNGTLTVTATPGGSANAALVATATLNQYALTVTRGGNGAGAVASGDGNISCGATCNATYNSGTVVTLSATPAIGSTFAGWAGAGCSGVGTCAVTMSAAASVFATFNLIPYTLTVTRAGNGSGTVTSSPAGINNCGTMCAATYNYGTSVTLTATGATGSLFSGWSGGGCSGTGACVVSITTATTVTATFTGGVITGEWDPAWSLAGVSFSNGNLSISGNTVGTKNVRTNVGKSTGKWYWEVTATAGTAATNGGGLGILEAVTPNNVGYIGSAPSGLGFGYGPAFGTYWTSWTGVTINGAPPAISAVTAGNVYMFALDMSTGRFWAGQNGTWYNAGNPATGTNAAATGITGTVYPGVTFLTSSINSYTGNFGGSSFNFAPPAGFNSGLYATPTTWDPTWSLAGITYTNGNKSIAGNSSGTKNVRTTIGKSSGKWYWEVTATAGVASTSAGGLGIIESVMPNNVSYIGSAPSGLAFGYGPAFGTYWTTWTGVTTNGVPPANSAVTAGNVYMFALDLTSGRFWAGQNGTWYNAGNPATGANPAATGITGTVYPGVTFFASSIDAFTANFGPSGFTYAVPASFQAGFY